MPDVRNSITLVSLAIAVTAVGWSVYTTRHAAVSAPPDGPRAASGGQRATVAVLTAPARPEQLHDEIEAVGSSRANEAVDVTSKTTNIVTAVHFDDGERVTAGQVLVELDSAQARAELAQNMAALTESSAQLNRSKDLLARQLLAKSAYDTLEATMKADEARVAASRARLEDTVIRAPFSGHVGFRRVSVGSLINPGTIITTLDDTGVIKLDFAVPERYVSLVNPGALISARSAAWPARTFQGRVLSLDSRVDANTRAVTVRARVANDDGALRPGMFLTVSLAGPVRHAVTVPEEAIVPEQSRQYVFVVAGNRASKREVQLGQRQPGKVEVVHGLADGETVVIDGTLRLSDGVMVRAAVPAAQLVGESNPHPQPVDR